MTFEENRRTILEGKAILGLELGSTRVKAVLIGEDHAPLAGGGADWENRLENGIWTYSLEDVKRAVQESFRSLKENVYDVYGLKLNRIAAMGFSGMMHGYLPFDGEGNQLSPFRTWRNTITEKEAAELSELFGFNVPQRWSVSHLYQAVRTGEEHAKKIRRLTTVAGYLHWVLTGEFVLGVGEASGMFPIDEKTGDYDQRMVDLFEEKIRAYGMPWRLRDILPRVLPAGAPAGRITPKGALYLDPYGDLEDGSFVCPPEGDAGTGMAATNSVTPRTGNVSAGTSIFSMVVLEKPLAGFYPEIDVVATPAGKPVAMAHRNNCTSDINAWAALFMEVSEALGKKITRGEALDAFFRAALDGEEDAGGVIAYPFFSGEHILGLEAGRPMLLRGENARFTFGNLARASLYSAMATLKIGMDILSEKEAVAVDSLLGHGGFFKAKGVGQKLMASALKTPVTVMETAGEGGPWGMALLAAYAVKKAEGESLESYLRDRVFAGAKSETVAPDGETAAGFDRYLASFRAALPAEKKAVELLEG
ncbi:MAG: ATPase [Clostridia bacterium]|nr:ATPase [Clostridia bacterium]